MNKQSNLNSAESDKVGALLKQAVNCYHKGELKEAIALCQEAIQLKPDLAVPYLVMGNTLGLLGNFEEAIDSYSQALELQPNLVAAYANLGGLYLKQGKLDLAWSNSQKAIALDPKLAIVYWNLGQILNEQNRLDEAISYWEKALKLKPDLVGTEFHQSLGDILQSRGKLDEAIAYYQKALESKGDDAELCHKLGDICCQKGNYDDGIFYYIKALQIMPIRKQTYSSIGVCLQRQGRFDDANICFSMLLPFNILQEFGRLTTNLSATSTLKHPSIERIKIADNSLKKSFLNSGKTLDGNIHPHFKKTELQSPETFVAIVPNGRAWGDFYSSAIITEDNLLLEDISTGSAELIATSNKLPEVRFLEGRVAFLSIRGVGSYYHWMSDLIPRIELIRLSGIALNTIDFFVVNSCNLPFHRETLEILGISQNKIIESSQVPYLKASSLIVPSLPGYVGQTPKWVCDFLRREYLQLEAIDKSNSRGVFENFKPKRTKVERIYISRSQADARRIINEDEVFNFLNEFGFERVILESISFAEQVSLLASAKVVIAPHGAGLTNLVFCNQGTKVIEIFSPNYVNSCFWVIANQVGLEYYYLIGDGLEERQKRQTHPAAEDILVNIERLSKIIQLAGIELKSFDKAEQAVSNLNYSFREINLIVFPDWSQSEESLYHDFAKVLKAIASHPERGQIALLVDTSSISQEDADMALSSMVMNLMMEEELDVEEGPDISLVGELSQIQWEALLSLVWGKIHLECENKEAIARVKAENLPAIELDSLPNKIHSFQTKQ